MRHRSLVPVTVTYNTLIDGLCKSGRISRVQDLLDEMHKSEQPPDLITYNILIRTGIPARISCLLWGNFAPSQFPQGKFFVFGSPYRAVLAELPAS
ncbi:hypothetical protein PIB30_007392 [Stylosanthes scabra]|uniref:Pentatricopeptide repeat-containing protein n=1 Tax=Stylosanthes scabra TaxID=79078 RepID=A0ABU6Z2E3_9FABA|nr:hypothetical protein [Stylosanthes scabra]